MTSDTLAAPITELHRLTTHTGLGTILDKMSEKDHRYGVHLHNPPLSSPKQITFVLYHGRRKDPSWYFMFQKLRNNFYEHSPQRSYRALTSGIGRM